MKFKYSVSLPGIRTVEGELEAKNKRVAAQQAIVIFEDFHNILPIGTPTDRLNFYTPTITEIQY